MLGWILLLVAFAASFGARGADLALTLGTATAGGGFTVYGEALAAAVEAADPGLELRLQQTAGSQENIPLLRTGQLDLGLVEGTAAQEALGGADRLAVVAVMYPSPSAFAVRADSTYRSIADLKGQRVVFGAAGSGFVLLARHVLEALDLDLDRDFDAVLLKSAGEGPALVIDGRAAAMWGGGIGWPAFRALADGPAGARLIVPSAKEIARIHARHPFLQPMTLPAGSYRGQDRDLATIGTWSLILARPDLAEETVYRFARALARAQPALGSQLAQARETTLANTLRVVPQAQLHPGVLRHLRESGLIR